VTERISQRSDAVAGALLGTFVGDALGMPYEGLSAAAVPSRLEMVEARRGRGTYTDDTEMMIVLAESLLEQGCVNEERLAQAFLERCDPTRGYGAGTLEVLALWRQGVPVDAAARRLFDGEGSLGNGAAMRISPIAVLFADSPDELHAQAKRSARLTHAHPLAVDAAIVQAAAIAAALRGEDILAAGRTAARRSAMRGRLDQAAALLGSDIGPAAVGELLGNSATGHESVPTAMFAAASHTGFEEAVSFAVRCGGDTDTLGAMAGALAGAAFGSTSIPARWLDALENGHRGRRYVERLVGALLAATAVPR
jgi:poly(ADP-ribose) glycohydrolase ARH3